MNLGALGALTVPVQVASSSTVEWSLSAAKLTDAFTSVGDGTSGCRLCHGFRLSTTLRAPVSAARPKTSSAGIVDACSVRGASTVTATGLAGAQVSGREVFGLVD